MGGYAGSPLNDLGRNKVLDLQWTPQLHILTSFSARPCRVPVTISLLFSYTKFPPFHEPISRAGRNKSKGWQYVVLEESSRALSNETVIFYHCSCGDFDRGNCWDLSDVLFESCLHYLLLCPPTLVGSRRAARNCLGCRRCFASDKFQAYPKGRSCRGISTSAHL